MSRGYFAVGLVRPKNPINIGSALRATYCFGGALLAVEWRKSVRYSADTTKAWRHLPVIRTDNLTSIIPYGCEPVVIEITPDACPLATFTHPERAFYIFGPEDSSVPERVLESCKRRVSLPSRCCLNLAACVNVVLYDRVVKRGEGFEPVAMGGRR